MNFDRMRALLLEQTVQGKLVPQLEDEPAVEQIGEAPKIEPFAIPKKWKWVRLLDSFAVYQPKTISTKEFIDGGDYLVYGANGVIGRYDKFNHEESQVAVACRGATCGSVNVTEPKSWINGNAMVISPKDTDVNKHYLVAYLKSINWKNFITGSAQPQITRNNLTKMLFPIPPVKEQRRIVAKLEESFAEIDRAEKAYRELQTLAGVLRGKILQEAVMGKLVPQLDEEPAVEQIGDTPEDVPFAIPEKWKWVRLSAVGEIVGGGTPKTGVSEYWDGDISWITPADLGKNSDQTIYSGAKLITKKGLDKSSAKLMPKGSIVYSSRAPIGHIAVAGKELCTNQGCKSFVPETKFISTEWAYYILIARTRDIQSRASGTTFKEISGKGMGETWISLPPLPEQRRIVAKVEELMAQVDRLAT